MKIYKKIPEKLKPFYTAEISQFKEAYDEGNLATAWSHLERAHILGQKYPYEHTCVHWKMLQFGIRIKSSKEVIGQIPRLLFGGVKSFVGKIPKGNPGGSNVPPLKPFPIEKELRDLFIAAGIYN